MAILQALGSFPIRKELNDNQSDTLDLCPQGSASSYELVYSLRKNVSGNTVTGRIKIDDSGNLILDSFEYEVDDFICDVDITAGIVAGKIQLQFVLNNVGENLTLNGNVTLI